MKKFNFYFYLIGVFALFAAGCGKAVDVEPDTPSPTSGTFAGQFEILHINSTTGKVRIDSCNLTLVMEPATGYAVSGDTSVLHAASYGTYNVLTAQSHILFTDKTFPATGTPAKVHLNGPYYYEYDGNTLILLGPADSVQYYYNMKRTGN